MEPIDEVLVSRDQLIEARACLLRCAPDATSLQYENWRTAFEVIDTAFWSPSHEDQPAPEPARPVEDKGLCATCAESAECGGAMTGKVTCSMYRWKGPDSVTVSAPAEKQSTDITFYVDGQKFNAVSMKTLIGALRLEGLLHADDLDPEGGLVTKCDLKAALAKAMDREQLHDNLLADGFATMEDVRIAVNKAKAEMLDEMRKGDARTLREGLHREPGPEYAVVGGGHEPD